jgi:hypothetical protein
MNKILKYLKKNIFLVCFAIVLVYIAYDKLYKKEGLENSCDSIFGKKDERIVLSNMNDTKVVVFDMNGIKQKHFWIDLQSIKINGSKKLALVDANQYDVVKKRLNTCEDINIQNNNLKKNLDQYKNRGFFARLFNW